MIPIIRQLAEAEDSPVTSIKEQNQETRGNQLRQSSRPSGGVQQFEIRRDITCRERSPHAGSLAQRHSGST